MANTGKIYKCSTCGSLDHTARNHDKATSIVAMAPSKPASGRKCSYCYCAGHYAKTCSARIADEMDLAMAKQFAAQRIMSQMAFMAD
mgnify:CR=1 FL=1